MPTVIPIPGGGDGPYVTTTYVAHSSVVVESVSVDVSLSSADVLARKVSATGYESLLVSNLTQRIGLGSVVMGNFHIDTYFSAIDVVAGDSFDILADLLEARLSGPNLGAFGYYEIQTKLLVNGTEVAIKRFNYQVPSGKLGAILNITLADTSVASVPAGATIRFSLLVTMNGITSEHVLLDAGKLQERSYTISMTNASRGGPADEITFSSLDVISDKFGLSPRRSVTMFDPARVRYDQVRTDVQSMIRDSNHVPIQPVVEPVFGLTMKQILQRAYTGLGGFTFISALGTSFGSVTWQPLIGAVNQLGCRFLQVITNIPDYPVRRADFMLEAGWHDGAKPVVMMYAPVYFVDNNKLYILDVEKALPAGITSRVVALSEHKSLSERIEFKPDTNAVLLTYQYNANDPSEDPQREIREVFHDEVVDAADGKFPGEVGYSKTTIRRWDREYFLPTEPGVVLDTLPLSSAVETQQTIWYAIDDVITVTRTAVVHKETTDYLYEGDLLVRMERNVEALVIDPTDSNIQKLIDVENETQYISWTEDPNNPGVKIQDRVRSYTEERIAYNPDESERGTYQDLAGATIEYTQLYPFLLAQRSGLIDNSWIMGESLVPTKIRVETLRRGTGNQYNVEVVEQDLINHTLQRSYVAPTTGKVWNDPFEAKSRTILLVDAVSEAAIGPRIPLPVNAYELPRARAIELGQRVLKRLKDPLMTMPLSMAGVDFAIARGSVIKGQKRTGYTGNYFVTGYNISGDNLGREGHRVRQSLEAVQIVDP